MIHLSIVICCYNSQSLIQQTLSYICSQQVTNGFKYEVILVDNNCTDQTAAVARKYWDSQNTKTILKIVPELKPGLSYARKKGVSYSNSNLVLFCDDDNWLQKDYLKIAFDFMQEHSEVGALGGQSIGALESNEPAWWQNHKTSFAVGKQATSSGDISKRGYLWGAGLVVRKKILESLEEVNFISLLADRKGKELSSGGDSEICKWVLLSQHKLWYLEQLKFHHFITANRLELNYLEKLLAGHEKAQPILNLYNRFIYFERINKGINVSRLQDYRLLKKSIKYFFKNDKQWKVFMQIALGTRMKIHSNLYHIITTYKKLNLLINK